MTLVSLSTPGRLYASHRDGFERARLALHIAGIESGTSDPLHAVRTVTEQESLFFDHYTSNYAASTKSDKRWYKGVAYWRRPGKSAAAIPGTSNHGNGDTVDWQGLGAYGTPRFLRAARILADHGWNNAEGRSVGEPWHWTRVAGADNHSTEEVITVSQYDELMKVATAGRDAAREARDQSKANAKEIAAIKAAVTKVGSYKDSSLARELAIAAGVDPKSLSDVKPEFSAAYDQAAAFALRELLERTEPKEA